jgi:hypothetical protein
MAIIESGIIINGMPVIRSEYYPSEFKVDPFLRTGLFTAIQTFASKAFSDEAEEMRLKKYTLLIKDLNKKSDLDQLMLYLVVERGTDLVEIRKRLNIIYEKIDIDKIVIDRQVNEGELSEIKSTIDVELKDLCMKAEDRAKSVFG